MLAHQSTELGTAEKHCLRFFRSARIGDVVAVGSESLTSKSLAGRRDDWNKSASDFDLVAEHYVSAENDEDAVCRRAPLIQLESTGPRGSRAVRAYWRYFFRSETRPAHSLSSMFHLALMISTLVVL